GESVWLIDVPSGRVTDLGRPPSQAWSLAFSRDGRWLAVSGTSSAIFDGRTGELLARVSSGGTEGFFVGFTADGALLHGSNRSIRRTEIREEVRARPEESLREVLRRHRLRLVGQRMEQDNANR